MNKQLMLEIVQFATIMLVAIIISGFNPSFLMLVCMQLSACTSLALINHEQYSWMYGVAAMLIIINPSVLTFVPFILVNIALFYCSIKATLFIASFLYDMKAGNEQLQPKPDADDSSNIKVTERKDENIIGSLEKEKHNCCICLESGHDEILIAGSSIQGKSADETSWRNTTLKYLGYNNQTTLYDEKIKIFDGHGVCPGCFNKYPKKAENPMSRATETAWHLFKDGKYITTKEVEPKARTIDAQYQSPVAAFPAYIDLNTGELNTGELNMLLQHIIAQDRSNSTVSHSMHVNPGYDPLNNIDDHISFMARY